MKTFIWRFFLLLAFLITAVVFIAFARGYRLNFNEGKISPTGILAVSSSPRAAKVFVNGQLKGVTDLNLTLPPGTYSVEIKKEGFAAYHKTLVLKGELVETIDPVLFPINPSLSPLTNLGVAKAIQVDQSDRIIILSDTGSETEDGIYVFDTGNKPLTFFPPIRTLLLKQVLPTGLDFKTVTSHFSPEFKEALLDFPLKEATQSALPLGATSSAYLLALDTENQEAFDVSSSKETLLEAWREEEEKERLKIIETYPKKLRSIALKQFEILSFSPDQTKILYRAKQATTLPLVINPPLIASSQAKEERTLQKNHVYVYDKREDKNFHIASDDADEDSIRWYADSKRLVFKETRRIIIGQYDGQNKQTVYSGPFEEGFFSVNSAGQLVILANLNPQSNKFPDLYLVGIR